MRHGPLECSILLRNLANVGIELKETVMTTIYITAVHMVGGAGHQHIANLKWRNPESGKTGHDDRQTLVRWVATPNNVARVTDGRNTVDVGVHPCAPPYLRTHADGKWSDNLLALPRY